MKKIIVISSLIFILLFLISSKCYSEPFANSENNQMIWDGKISTTNKVIENLKKEWSKCGFNEFDLKSNDLSIINSRKKLIELLPVTKMIGKLDFDKIKCFISKYDPENYVVISKTITNVPKILKPRNIIIVNNMLYQSTPYGVLKYEIPKLINLKKNTSLNASIEANLINDFNIYNMSNYPIYILDGKLLQKRENKIVDLKNKDEHIFSTINNKIELLPKNEANKPAMQPAMQPAMKPAMKPAMQPAMQLAMQPAMKPAMQPAMKPAMQLAMQPAMKPAMQLAMQPAMQPAINLDWLMNPNKEKMTNIEEMVNLTMNPGAFLPMIKIQPGQTIEKIKKLAEEAAKNKLVETTIMKAVEQANLDINKAKDLLVINPNDVKAKKDLEVANKKLLEVKKATNEILNKDINKKDKEEAAKKLIQNTIINDIKKAEENAKKANDLSKNNPNDSKAKKEADDANKKYEEIKKTANDIINKLVDNKTISKDNKNELTIKINEIDLSKLLNNLVSVVEYNGVVYICQHNSVKPLSKWAVKLNEMINKNKLTLLTVIPHFYYLDNKFNFVLIFIFNDDFCIILNKENLSDVLDIKSVLGTSFSPKLPDKIGCDDLQVILEQMTKSNVITAEKSKSLLKRYKC